MTKKTPNRVRGFFTRSRDTISLREQILSTLLDTYALYGFDRLETPSIESQALLAGNLPDTDRPNEGLITADLGETPAALRYDLTAPLAQYCQDKGDTLPKPFLRATSGLVWRNEKPSPGRSREFWQCDADCVGGSLSFFPTMLAMVDEGLKALNTPKFTIKLNDRRLLDSIMDKAAIDPQQRMAALRTLDKRDRIGLNGVDSLLGPGLQDDSGAFIQGLGLTSNQRTIIIDLLTRKDSWMDIAMDINPVLGAEWQTYITLLDTFSVPYTLDISIARGLNYYTGPVFEIIVDDPNTQTKAGGAIGAGGAYDLYKKTGRTPLYSFGVSVGVDRLTNILEKPKAAPAAVLVMSLDNDNAWETNTAAQIRSAGITALTYPGVTRTFTKRLKWADKTGLRFAVFQGGDEREQGLVQIKDLKLGKALSKTADKETWDTRPQQWSVKQEDLLKALVEQ